MTGEDTFEKEGEESPPEKKLSDTEMADEEDGAPTKKKRKNRRKNKRRKKAKEAGEADENSEELDRQGKVKNGTGEGESAELIGKGDCAQEDGVLSGDGVTH